MDPLLERAFGAQSMGEWRLVPTSGNRLPTAASYLKRPGDTVFRAYKFDPARAKRLHRRDHHLRRAPVPEVRPPRHPRPQELKPRLRKYRPSS
jgi:hypothetical protein